MAWCAASAKVAHECPPWVFGEDTAVIPEKFCRVEDQEVWGQAQELGREIAARLKGQLC